MEGSRIVFFIQKAVSALISNMNKVTFIFLALFASGPAQCFPVTASQSGFVQVFFCKIQGCAANVTNLFCNEKLLFSHTHIADCKGPPPPNNVCQHDGRAYVCIDTKGGCEFEGNDGYIETEKCTDHSDICAFINATTPSPVTVQDHATTGCIVVGVCGVIPVIVGLFLYFRNKRRNREQQPDSGPDVTEPLTDIQSPEETSERDTCIDGPELDGGGGPPSQCDHRA